MLDILFFPRFFFRVYLSQFILFLSLSLGFRLRTPPGRRSSSSSQRIAQQPPSTYYPHRVSSEEKQRKIRGQNRRRLVCSVCVCVSVSFVLLFFTFGSPKSPADILPAQCKEEIQKLNINSNPKKFSFNFKWFDQCRIGCCNVGRN
jgi:hypothetical protein